MQTRCPQCDTIFRISDEQLALASGRVRCGECDKVFDARASMIPDFAARASGDKAMQLEAVTLDPVEIDRDAMQFDIPGLEIPSSQASHDGADQDATTAAEIANEVQEVTQESIDSPPGDAAAESVTAETTASSQKDERAASAPTGTGKPSSGYNVKTLFPEFDTTPAIDVPPRPLATLAGVLTVLVLVVMLLAQYVYFDRDNLARHAALRPPLAKMCELLDCKLAALREPERVRLLRHEVNSHPTHPDALYIEATIVNEAEANQAYPLLRVMFRDPDGRLLAQRDFRPAEYLPGDVDAVRGMTPAEPVNILLELVDPGKKAVSYEFDFL